MKKKHKKICFLFSVFCFLLPTICNISCKDGCPLTKKDAPVSSSAPTEEKFLSVSKWIPESVNTIVVLDTYKIAHKGNRDTLVEKTVPELLRYFNVPGIDFKSNIGMLAFFMKISSPSDIAGPALIIQGGFDENVFASRILKQADIDKLNVKGEDFGGVKIYSENIKSEDQENSYAFAALERGLFATAKLKTIKWMIENSPKKPNDIKGLTQAIDWGVPIYGVTVVSDELSKSLPSPWNGIRSIKLEADIAEDISARLTIDTKETGNIEKLTSALEGIKAIEALQILDDLNTLKMIEKIRIVPQKNGITIDIPQDLGLLKILAEERTKKNESAKSD